MELVEPHQFICTTARMLLPRYPLMDMVQHPLHPYSVIQFQALHENQHRALVNTIPFYLLRPTIVAPSEEVCRGCARARGGGYTMHYAREQ